MPENNTASWERKNGVDFAALTLKRGQEEEDQAGQPGLVFAPRPWHLAPCWGPDHSASQRWDGTSPVRLPVPPRRRRHGGGEGIYPALGTMWRFLGICSGFGKRSWGIQPRLQPITIKRGDVCWGGCKAVLGRAGREADAVDPGDTSAEQAVASPGVNLKVVGFFYF